jgi:amino acid transporter
MEQTNSSPQIETVLSRDFGPPSALAIGVGTIIAAGIFTLSGLAVRNVGAAAIVSFLLAAAVAILTALAFCEFAALYPESGGGYLYARRTLRPLTGYFVGWALFLGYTSSCAFYIASLSAYFKELIWDSPAKDAAGVAALLILTAAIATERSDVEDGSSWQIRSGHSPLISVAIHNGHAVRRELAEFFAVSEHDRLTTLRVLLTGVADDLFNSQAPTPSPNCHQLWPQAS